MKRKGILFMLSAGVLFAGLLGACAPADQIQTLPVTPQQQAAGITAATPVSPEPLPGAGPGRRVTIVSMSEMPAITPARHGSLLSQHVNEMTHAGLFRLRYEDMAPIPNLVSDWRAVSDILFEFTIHEGILFHNGDEMTAYDIAASLEYNRLYPDSRAFQGSAVDWEVVDRYTIRIGTGTPNALLINDLAHHGNFIHPKSLIDAGHDFMVHPVGAGPFAFDEWRHGDFLNFLAFEKYFDTERSPRVEYIHWRIIPEGASRTIALETGEVDYVIDVAFPDVPRMEANPDITVIQRRGATFQYFIMNNSRPPFDNVYVRRAIDMALDREAMVMASLDGFGVPIRTTMPPIFPGSTEEGTRAFDPAAARALLIEQGIPPADLNFELLAFDEQQRRRAEVAQANLADIGITVSIVMIDFTAWMTLTLEDAFDMSFANFTPPNLPTFMRSTMSIPFINGQNRARIYNQELTDLIFESIATINESERIAILEEAGRIANEYVGHIGTNMNMLIRAFNANLIVPELAANGAMHINMMYWLD